MEDVAERGVYRVYRYEWGTLRRLSVGGMKGEYETISEVYDGFKELQERVLRQAIPVKDRYWCRWQYLIVQHFNTTAVGSRIRAIVSFDENALMKVTTVE